MRELQVYADEQKIMAQEWNDKISEMVYMYIQGSIVTNVCLK